MVSSGKACTTTLSDIKMIYCEATSVTLSVEVFYLVRCILCQYTYKNLLTCHRVYAVHFMIGIILPRVHIMIYRNLQTPG